MGTICYTTFLTKIGYVAIAWKNDVVIALQLPAKNQIGTKKMFTIKFKNARFLKNNRVPTWIDTLIQNICSHLDGKPQNFSRVKIDLENKSIFCKKIYEILRKTKAGSTISYGELARKAGSPKSARGVGQTLKCNPYPIIVPCHRVLAANKKPGGFSAPGGIKTKFLLLKIEGFSY
jgi:methylated-DNA-[protein]-cysteine S-methyltransferase